MKVSTTSPFFSVALLVISMLSIQCSASLAKSVFPIIGPEATTALRLMFAALVLLPVMRPWRAKLTRKQWLPIILYGLSTGVMNMCFYQAISRIPLGVGVALEFTGPLAIAMLGSRRLIDFLWIALAVGGNAGGFGDARHAVALRENLDVGSQQEGREDDLLFLQCLCHNLFCFVPPGWMFPLAVDTCFNSCGFG